MDTNTSKFKVRLGLFIAGGTALFIIAIFIIGRQKNLFNPVFKIHTTFYSVGGLEVGNNIRFSGITVGTVDNIVIVNDSTVKVDLVIQKHIQKFIKTDCVVGIGSSGIIGNSLINISQGSNEAPMVKNGQYIESKEPVELDNIMASLEVTAINVEVITNELAEVMIKFNTGQGIGRLLSDSSMFDDLGVTMVNLKNSTEGLNQNMNAAKENIFFRGYFKRKEKAAEDKKKEAEKNAKNTEIKKNK